MLYILVLLSLFLDNRRVTGRAKRIVPKPPPVPYSRPAPSINTAASSGDDQNQTVCIYTCNLEYVFGY